MRFISGYALDLPLLIVRPIFGLRLCVSQCLPPRLAVRVEERPLPQAHGPVPETLALLIVIKGSGMEDATVVPDS